MEDLSRIRWAKVTEGLLKVEVWAEQDLLAAITKYFSFLYLAFRLHGRPLFELWELFGETLSKLLFKIVGRVVQK